MNDTLIASIHSLSHEGRGIGSIEGKTVFIENALPEETVLFRYRKRRKRFDEGSTISILKPSPARVIPRCIHFEQCGGCALQHLDSHAQVLFKQQVVLEHLQHFGNVQPLQVLAPLTGSFFGYRRRARLGVKFVAKKEKVLVGFREKSRHYIADLERCEILHPRVGQILLKLKNLLSNLEAYQAIPQIEVAIGDEDVALVFRNLIPLTEKDQELLISFGRGQGITIYLQPEGLDSVSLLWSSTNKPNLSYKLSEYDIEIQFSPTDFVQVNSEINCQMVKRAIELLDLNSTDRVLDLFCGLGNFTLPMAKFASSVVGVEASKDTVQRACQNAVHNDISNVEFYVDNLQTPCLTSSWAQRAYDKILLDPPRAGVLEIIPLIAKLAKNRIVYVSCNPATFARDIGELVGKYQFKLESVGVLDMFPHTTHVESIAVLQR